MAITYLDCGGTSTPLKGRYLQRSLKNEKEAAFVGADLYAGKKHLVDPSLEQSAFIVGSDVNSVWWALRRQQFRDEIVAELMPLVPARAVHKVNGTSLVDLDAMLAEAIGQVGLDRTLAIAVQVERNLAMTS